MEKLNPAVRATLPVFVTERAAIHNAVLGQVSRNVISGKSFKDEADGLSELHTDTYYERMLAYYAFHSAKAAAAATKGQNPISAYFGGPQAKPPLVELFPMPKTTGFRIGMGPQYLIELYVRQFNQKANYYARCLAALGGKAICGDHTFKTAKNVTAASGARLFAAVWDMMNEIGQVISLIFTESKSMDEIQATLSTLNKAWEECGAQVRFFHYYLSSSFLFISFFLVNAN